MRHRILGPTRSKRRRRLLLLLPIVALAALVLAIGAAATGPVGIAAGFEDNDGNLAPATGGFDWNSFSPTTWTGTAPQRTSSRVLSGWKFLGLEDWQSSTSDSAFAGGTKQDDECASLVTQKANNKEDLKRIYLASKTINGHTYLMLAWVRIPQNSTSNSANIAFEFNRGSTACGAGSDGLVHRSVDTLAGAPDNSDMLIVYDFTGGAGSPTLRLERWIASGTCEVGSSSPPCWGVATTLPAGTAEGAVDTGLSGLPSSVLDSIGPSSETLGTVEFGEAGIDLTNVGVFSAGTCETFGKAFGVSRTSGNSQTAQMKDLVGPGNFTLTNCATVNVTKVGSDGGSQAGVVFTLTGPSPSTATQTCTVDATGQCGSNPSFANLQPGSYTLSESNTPAGYDPDASLPETFTINAGDSVVKSYTDVAQPGSIQITKNDDAGDPIPNVTFTAYGPSPSTSAAGNCITDATGSCTISGLTPGSYSVDETGLPTGYIKDPSLPATVVVAKGGTATLNVTDPRKFKVIVIVCRQTDDSLYPSAIKIDGTSAGTSLSSASSVHSDLTDAELCGITAGARGGLRAAPDGSNPHSAEADIPNTQ
jgi:hypothetical protein